MKNQIWLVDIKRYQVICFFGSIVASDYYISPPSYVSGVQRRDDNKQHVCVSTEKKKDDYFTRTPAVSR